MRELGSAQAMVMAVDNSASMAGRPMAEAKRAAAEFLAGQSRAGRRAWSRSATKRSR